MWVAPQLMLLILPTASSQNQLGWNWRDFPGCVSHLLRLILSILSILGIFNAGVSSRKSWLWEWCGATKRLDHRTGEKNLSRSDAIPRSMFSKTKPGPKGLGQNETILHAESSSFLVRVWTAGETLDFSRKHGVPVLKFFACLKFERKWRVEMEEWKS